MFVPVLVTITLPAVEPAPPAPPRLAETSRLFDEVVMPPATLQPPEPPPPPTLWAKIPWEFVPSVKMSLELNRFTSPPELPSPPLPPRLKLTVADLLMPPRMINPPSAPPPQTLYPKIPWVLAPAVVKMSDELVTLT